ncbi:AzlD domain-containing protein [Thauera sinica]|uniref:AzlD domain-containing protein n=1 Tax=Thauera sinica TaxID=2665146 RepID=A0ABW1AWI1_9RHOO|nr:AzlD domain-containing protein [Thauera sp. K11]ATE61098.1 branched-chain amino acid ABC transporter [Thauera sp. K11]
MMEDVWLWITFGLLSLTTMLTRGSFILIGERGRLPPLVQRALRYAPAAALAALVVPDVLLEGERFVPFNPKLLAAVVVVAIALRTRNPWLPFILGMGVLIALRKGLGW